MQQDKLDYFVLAYESRTFSTAAAKVPMSSQGFTKAIRNLEKELGVPLFVIEEDGSRRATPFADEYYEYAKHVLAERARLDHAFDRIIESEHMDIRIAFSLGTPGFLGPDFLEGYTRLHPNVTITVAEMPDNFCETLLSEGTCDLAIVVLPSAEEFITRPLYTTSILWWVHTDNPLANKEHLSVEDVLDYSIAIPGDEFKCNQNLIRQANRLGIQNPSIVHYSEIFWIYEFVLQGKGIGFTLPHLATLDVFQSDSLVAIPSTELTWSFGAVWPKQHRLNSFEQDFVDYAETFAHSLPFQIQKANHHNYTA